MPASPPHATCCPRADRPSAADANAALREYAAGRRSWSAAQLVELDRLRSLWLEAVRREEALRQKIVAAA